MLAISEFLGGIIVGSELTLGLVVLFVGIVEKWSNRGWKR
jgi:predicted membrane protein